MKSIEMGEVKEDELQAIYDWVSSSLPILCLNSIILYIENLLCTHWVIDSL